MRIFDRYIFKNLAIAAVLVTVTLVVVVFLSQSLRFLELVIDAGASSISFWILTLLALPRFFEIIVPLALMAATIFIYNRMTMDSEIVAIRSAGFSPYALAKPALTLSLIAAIFLWIMTLWVAPVAMSGMYAREEAIKGQFSALLFHDGVFNQVGENLTVYIHDRAANGDLRGLMIYDARDEKRPATIIAKRGVLVGAEGHEVMVYDGSRQELDYQTGKLQRLNFERYAVELPGDDTGHVRWREPDERTIFELFNPDMNDANDRQGLRGFRIEIHRRIAAPFLALAFTMLACSTLLLGPMDRRGQGKRITLCVLAATIIQGMFLASFSLSRKTDVGIILMYVIAFAPLIYSYYWLNGKSLSPPESEAKP